MDSALLRQRNFALLLLISLAACSHTRPMPEVQVSEATTSQTPQPLSELEQTRQQVAKLQDRVQDLETRLSALNDKINVENGGNVAETTTNKIPTVAVEVPSGHGRVIPAKKIASKPRPVTADISDDDSSEAVDRFREAKILYDSKRYSDSVLEFAEFVKNESEHPLAPAAQYYVGMSYLKQNEYKLAEEELSRGLLSYAHSNYVPDTLLALSEVSRSLKKPEKVTYYQEKLVASFPNSPQAKKILSKESDPVRTMETGEASVVSKPEVPQVNKPTLKESSEDGAP